jgi:hypothetical protein
MSKGTVTSVVVVALIAYGLYTASYLLPMLVGSPPIMIVVGFALESAAALVAAVGVWWHRSWAPFMLLVLGAAIAFTAIVEGFVLGVVGYNHAVAVAVTGLVLTILAAIYFSVQNVDRRLSTSH